MKKIFITIGVFALFWLIFFFFARFLFIVVNHKAAFQFSFMTLASTFLHGLKLDISATAYVLIIPSLAVTAGIWIRGGWFLSFLKWYTYLLIFIFSVIIAGDAILYTYWGFRLDYTVMLYLKTPKEAAASASTVEIAEFLVTIVFSTIIFAAFYKWLSLRLLSRPDIRHHRVAASFFFLLFTGALIIPVRGGTGLAPVNAGSVYFSDDMFVNHTAINVVWNAGSSLFNRKPDSNPYTFTDLSLAKAETDSLLSPGSAPEYILNTERPDIILIILESFGGTMIGALGGDSLATPRLNSLSREGILFDRFYASGNRTDKALPAVLSGYPAQPAVSIIKEPKKTQSLGSIVRILDTLGYRSSFWYGGDINFANINSYIISTGFHQVITMNDFSSRDYNSKWGVHDHILFRALEDSMTNIREPFFRVVLTLSSHEPFEIPVKPVFRGNDEFTKYRNSVHYTDSALGEFIDWAKKKEWWKNTLVVLVADHCRRNNQNDLLFDPKVFRIPMIWLGGALKPKGMHVEKTGSQVDIPGTILDQMKIHSRFPFGKDLLSPVSSSFAFYTYNEGFAFITDTSAYIYDQKLHGPVLKSGNGTGKAERLGKAFLQVLYDDYLKR